MPHKNLTCFVAMPFGGHDEYEGGHEESQFIFSEIIEPAVENAVGEFQTIHPKEEGFTLDIIQELEKLDPGDITEQIVRKLASACLSIIDLTGKNPNVFFELGIRFALKRNGTILLTQDKSDLPFDISHYRVVEYRPKYSGIQKAKEKIQETVLQVLLSLSDVSSAQQDGFGHSDSLVHNSIKDLEVRMGAGANAFEVSWEQYWRRVEEISECLIKMRSSGVYEPDFIVGVTNGGLFAADTILRLVYGNEIPLISLWADRTKQNYFENPINDAVVNSSTIEKLLDDKKEKRKIKRNNKSKINMLVIDDILGTMGTFSQLLSYFGNRLDRDMWASTLTRLVVVYSSRQDVFEHAGEFLLSSHEGVGAIVEEKELNRISDAEKLPYLKAITYADESMIVLPKTRRVHGTEKGSR